MNILFLCRSNVFRSQMAEAWYKTLSNKHKISSAALLNPQERIHALVVQVMKEFGLDYSGQYSKKLTPEAIKDADIVILMSKDLKSHFLSYKSDLKSNVKVIYWDIQDIIAKETDIHLYEKFVKACELIRDKVKSLVLRYG